MNSVIDIQNSRQILDYLIAKFKRIGWHVSPNVTSPISWGTLPNNTARYFTLSYDSRMFEWCYNDDNSRGDEDVIATIEDAHGLVEFVEKNTEVLRTGFIPYVSGKISKEFIESFSKTKINNDYYKTYYYHDYVEMMNPPENMKLSGEAMEKLKEMAQKIKAPIMTSHQTKKMKELVFIEDMDAAVEKIVQDKKDAIKLQKMMTELLSSYPLKLSKEYIGKFDE